MSIRSFFYSYGNKYKYILSGIDVASKYKVARPLRTKQAADIADICKVFPKIFQCDIGSKFKGEVTKLLEKHEVEISRVTMKYRHTPTAFDEALNMILTEQLFKVQGVQELSNPERVSSTCVKHLYGSIDPLNETKTQMTVMSPKDAIGLKEVLLINRENYPLEDILPEDGSYRYLLQPGEEHNDQHKRATDRIRSEATHRLREVVEDPGNQVMYCLSDDPVRAFVSEELILIPKDVELPPDYIQKW